MNRIWMLCLASVLFVVHGCDASVAQPQAMEPPTPRASTPQPQKPTHVAPSARAASILAAAEAYQGHPYVFGGRLGRAGCRRKGRPVRCKPGIDCQSLLFFAYEDVLHRRWWTYSVMPTETVRDQELGAPVANVDGVLRADLDPSLLAPGDVLFFLLEDYNLDVDGPLYVDDDRKYGTWHTGFFHGIQGGRYQILHAAPGEHVRIQPLEEIPFDALYAVRVVPEGD